jgi:iron(III) transport system permease protein
VSVDASLLFADVFSVIINTVTVASIAALLAVCLALVLLWSTFFAKQYKTPLAIEWISSGYAIPGTVVAIAVLWSFGWLDSQIGGLYFSGSLFALVFAYLFRFIKIAINPIDSSLSTTSKDCFSLLSIVSIPAEKRLVLGYWGLLKPGVMLALIFVFVECVKELPATLVIRPFNFETLSTYTYQLASDERVHDASLSALFIVMFALLPVYTIWLRLNNRENV